MTKGLVRFLLLGAFVLSASFAVAQPNVPGDPQGGTKPGDVPITGIEVLIGIGGLLGIKKINDLRKKR